GNRPVRFHRRAGAKTRPRRLGRSADGTQVPHNPAAAAPPGDDCVDAGPDLDSRWANLAVTQDSTPRLRRQTAALWDLSRSRSAQVMNGPKATSALSPFDSHCGHWSARLEVPSLHNENEPACAGARCARGP